MKTSLRVLQLLAMLGSACLLATPAFSTSDDESSTDLTDSTVGGLLPTYSTVTLDNLDLFVSYNTHSAITYNGENHAVHMHYEYNLYINGESYSIEEKNKDAIGILASDILGGTRGSVESTDITVSATGNSAYGFYHESGGTGGESNILYFRSSDITVEATGDDSDDDVTVAVGVYTEAGTSIELGLYDLDITVNAYESAAGYGIYNEGGPSDMEVDNCDITVNVEDLSGYGIYVNASDDDSAAIYLSDSTVTVTVESATALGMEYSNDIVPALYLSDVASGLVVDATDRSSDAIHTITDDSRITAEIKSGTGIATGISILGNARISLYDSHIEATTSAGVSVGVYLESTSDSTALYTNNTSVTASSTSGTVAAIYAVDSSQSITLKDTNLYITAQGELYGYALTAGEGLSNLASNGVGGIGIYNLEEDDSSNIIDSYDAYNDINVTSTGSADSGGTSTAYGVYLYKQDSYDNLFDIVRVSADDYAYGLYIFSSDIDTGVTIGTVTVTTTGDDAIGYGAYIEDSSISDFSGSFTLEVGNTKSTLYGIKLLNSSVTTMAANITFTTEDSSTSTLYGLYVDSNSSVGEISGSVSITGGNYTGAGYFINLGGTIDDGDLIGYYNENTGNSSGFIFNEVAMLFDGATFEGGFTCIYMAGNESLDFSSSATVTGDAQMLNLSDGAVLTVTESGFVSISDALDSTVSGTGTQLNINGTFASFDTTLIISDGATLTSTSGTICGSLSLKGTDTTGSMSNATLIAGDLNVSDGASLTMSGTLNIGTDSTLTEDTDSYISATGSGSTLIFDNVSIDAGDCHLYLNSYDGSTISFNGTLTTTGSVYLQDGSFTANTTTWTADSIKLGYKDYKAGTVSCASIEFTSDTVISTNALYLYIASETDYSTISVAEGVTLSFDDTVDMSVNVIIADDFSYLEGMSLILSEEDWSDLEEAMVSYYINDELLDEELFTISIGSEGLSILFLADAPEPTSDYHKLVRSGNSMAGALLLDAMVLTNPAAAGSDLALVIDSMDELSEQGTSNQAERLSAAIAGASVTALGSAQGQEMSRKLKDLSQRAQSAKMSIAAKDDAAEAQELKYNTWITGEGSYSELSNDGTAVGHQLKTWGASVGADIAVSENLIMGAAFGASYGDLSTDGPDIAEGDFDTNYVSLYASYNKGDWSHSFAASLGFTDADLTRTVSHANGSFKSKGETDGLAFGLSYELARSYSLNEDKSTILKPIASLSYIYGQMDGYTETGSDASLIVGEQENNYLKLAAGAELQGTPLSKVLGRTVTTGVRAMLAADLGDRGSEADVRLIQNDGTCQTVTGNEYGAIGIDLGISISVPSTVINGAFFIQANCELRDEMTNFNSNVGYRFAF